MVDGWIWVLNADIAQIAGSPAQQPKHQIFGIHN